MASTEAASLRLVDCGFAGAQLLVLPRLDRAIFWRTFLAATAPGADVMTRSRILLLAGLGLSLRLTPAFAQDPTLADTRWQLISIQSMDDSTYTPDDPPGYTVAFNADQTVNIVSDCNRANGSWASPGPNQLTFSALASSKRLCHPGSLDERFRAQFEWVRSYVLRDGNLYLATMADGAIIGFSPLEAPPVVAQLMGDDLRSTDPDAVRARILDRLFGAYAIREGLTASEDEVRAYLEDMDRTLAEALGEERENLDDLSPEEQAELRDMRETMARRMIERWKLNRALYDEYGGRVIYQQFGPEPLDAYREYLEARQRAGDFSFLDPAFETAFWPYFRDESIHQYYPPEEARTIFTTAPWEE
jgi:heat shock protein HslJ